MPATKYTSALTDNLGSYRLSPLKKKKEQIRKKSGIQ